MGSSRIGITLVCTALAVLVGLSKIVLPQERWRHSVALKATSYGPDKMYEVIEREGNSFLNEPFRRVVNQVINRDGQPLCDASFKKRCTLAQSSPGRVGEMRYKFRDPLAAVFGHSTQTSIACRCLDFSCRHGIIMQPRLIKNANKVACFYPKVQGKWSDCHTELLRIAERDVDDWPNDMKVKEPYYVELDNGPVWLTEGERRLELLEDEANLANYSTVSFESIIQDFEDREREDVLIFGNGTGGDETSFDTFSLDDKTEECSMIYTYARRGADMLSTKQGR
ncbi:hypothetical protein FGB62_93g052 [Gracilaria domingensis]|nr:hypothetical protein FGB62_93g052 [Gracilaria domingensis]